METTRNDELRILIVDAQAGDRALLCEQLLGLPERTFVFEEAYSGEDVLKKLERSAFQCILLDSALPDGGGVG